MLELIKINKSYKTGDFKQEALKNLTLKFREKEFVAILGPSGSGKTTLLNIIGGLDRYNSGDLIINGKSTKMFKEVEWDAYRNNCIGFVFQNYNLISHISVLQNVEMGMTLSGVSSKKRRKKAIELLEKVGLKEHMNKKPNQLSGGQMQRVAIARALANNPDIILADEPTGALDSTTSIQIMELIKEIAHDKLVIMVTHNADIANKYANRIIQLKDGKLINDSNPIDKEEMPSKFNIKKTAMNFLTALNLSFNNIITKKGRTLLTAFASSIGIIGISLILSLSNGFDKQIDKFEAETISSLPIIISQNSMEINMEELKEKHNEQHGIGKDDKYPGVLVAYPYDSIKQTSVHKNKFTKKYLDYINNINNNLLTGVSYTRTINLNLFKKKDDEIKKINSRDVNFQSIPKQVDKTKESYLSKNYDLLYGSFPTSKEELILIINTANKIDKTIINALGLDENKESIDFNEIIGSEIKIINNDNYYKEIGDYFTINDNITKVFDNEDNITLSISGIVRIKEDVKFAILNEGIGYEEELVEHILNNSKNSKIVQKQLAVDYNVLTGQKYNLEDDKDVEEKNKILSMLGGSTIPFMINLYPNNFEDKKQILNYLDDYNKGLNEDEQIIYTDLSATMSDLSGNIMDAITIVLIAFSSIALIVSSIMIGIITYISVLERTKEIGILRSLGARKKDIARVFNAETFIVGLTSGILGISLARLLIFPLNNIIEKMSNLPNVALLNPLHALLLILISLILTLIGGYVPAIIASKKDAVEALRTE